MMTDQLSICPYTGLRSFTEDESLYFKGRDVQVDQITALLEQNKFLMVTGASGEGKSSLIFAGLIPNARAGFFKAKYTNWMVAAFRPERSPVSNMAKAIAENFASHPATVETELRRGYSSLIDLYINSEFYIDEQDEQFLQLSDQEKKNKKRKAANLMILVDQFEEFFTNPENFFNETPSQDSQVVMNLLLETSRIAIKKNIPVYIVCTMRSDYIGQCSAFRGLPEYIGFSQFFVPRLKRKDLKQVIEEPAILSGNRISQRLIERLVYDISEGIDQLPILQHALSQIWLAANRGKEELDLIHYAKVGGMPADELPDQDQLLFHQWFNTQPEYKRKYFQQTGLNRVIDIHANILYETAWEAYNAKHLEKPITQQLAKRIIAITFSCLTKIDNSRAVRNRMTLGEINGIINVPDCSEETVGEVLSIFREEGNSFIRPFKTDDIASHKITSNTVLDITHESLIRNWTKLNQWANQEFEFYSTYLDFRKQLDRWKESGKSDGFLLPIGPLTFFENWFTACKPNIHWIKRYAEIQEDQQKALEDARITLQDIRDFLKHSARKVVVTRAFMKYGPQRIAIVLAMIIILVLSGFYWYDAEQKQNDQVLKKVQVQTVQLLGSKEVNNGIKAISLLINERYEKGYIASFIKELDPRERLSLTNALLKQVLLFDKHDYKQLKSELQKQLRADFTELTNRQTDYAFLLTELNQFSTLLAYDNYYNPTEESQADLTDMANEGKNVSLLFFKNKNLVNATISLEINYALQQWLTFGQVNAMQIDELLQQISPLEGDSAEAAFKVYYPKGSYEINGRVPNDFNGGYHTLASLYAATGATDNVIRCFEVIRQSGQNDYFVGSLFNNYNHILAILYQFGYRNKSVELVTWLGKNYPTNVPLTIYRNSVIRAGYISHLYRVNVDKNILRSFKGYFFPNLCLANRDVFNALADDYEKLIQDVRDPSERNYLLATNKKRRAMFTHKYFYDRGLSADVDQLEGLLEEAVDHHRKVDAGFLDESVSVTLPYFGDGVRIRNYKRRHLFIYPDYMEGWFSWTYHSDLFFNFISKNNLFNELYKTPEDLSFVHFWIAKAFEVKPFHQAKTFDNNFPISDEVLMKIISLSNGHPSGKSLDKNLIYLLLANRAFEKKDTVAGMNYYKGFDLDNFAVSRDKYEYLEKTFFLNQMKNLCVNLADAGKKEEAKQLAEKFEKDIEKTFAYIFMAEKVYMNQVSPDAFVFLDSALSKARGMDYSQFNFGAGQAIDFRFNLILLMSRIGGRELNSLSDFFLMDIIEQNKFNGIISKVYGVAEEGNFYRAFISIPSTLTESEDLISRALILWQACIKKESKEERKRWASMDDFFIHDLNYIYYLPS
jgi:energy-coupling factor transporter ATP-binding protein EcfA2